MKQFITTEIVESHIAIMTLNRPEAMNALSLKMLDEINESIQELSSDNRVRTVVLTGSGKKAFCAGADLKERKNMSHDETIKTVKYIGETISNIEKLPVPVIAAINGAAFGGGLEMALACDIRICSHHARLGLTETSLAIIPGAGGTQRLSRLIGIGKAKKMIYTAQMIEGKRHSA